MLEKPLKPLPLAESPEAWRRTAIGLKRSADLIWEQWYGHLSRLNGGEVVKFSPQGAGDLALLLPSYLLLLGLAYENALKGLLVAKEPSRVRHKVKWQIPKGGHDLKELCAVADFPLNSDEEEILKALTEATMWAGRYPVPKDHDGLENHPIPLGWKLDILNVDNVGEKFAEYKLKCDQLFARLHGDPCRNDP